MLIDEYLDWIDNSLKHPELFSDHSRYEAYQADTAEILTQMEGLQCYALSPSLIEMLNTRRKSHPSAKAEIERLVAKFPDTPVWFEFDPRIAYPGQTSGPGERDDDWSGVGIHFFTLHGQKLFSMCSRLGEEPGHLQHFCPPAAYVQLEGIEPNDENDLDVPMRSTYLGGTLFDVERFGVAEVGRFTHELLGLYLPNILIGAMALGFVRDAGEFLMHQEEADYLGPVPTDFNCRIRLDMDAGASALKYAN